MHRLRSAQIFDHDIPSRPTRQNCINIVSLCGEERLDGSFSIYRLLDQFGYVVSRRVLLVVFHLRNFANGPLTRALPGSRTVYSFAIDLEPIAHLYQAFFHDDGNCAVSLRTNVEQQVTASAYRIYEDENQFPP